MVQANELGLGNLLVNLVMIVLGFERRVRAFAFSEHLPEQPTPATSATLRPLFPPAQWIRDSRFVSMFFFSFVNDTRFRFVLS